MSSDKMSLSILFADMWEGFDPMNNFFIDMLKIRNEWSHVQGTNNTNEKYDLIVAGPFGKSWTTIDKKVPIVFFSGERWVRSMESEFTHSSRTDILYLTNDPIEDDNHMRLPIWTIYLNLFKYQNEIVVDSKCNPNGLPIALAATSQGDNSLSRPNFCGFVVSNPYNNIRNSAFYALHNYKKVDSGGAYMNNIGGPIQHLYGGGGGGDIAKYFFLKERKYCLCFENGLAPGYVTEKLLHAKMAGCIPIYWGDKHALSDFDPRGFIHIPEEHTPESIVRIVDLLEKNNDMALKIAKTPALSQEHIQKMLLSVSKISSEISKRVHNTIKNREIVESKDTSSLTIKETMSCESPKLFDRVDDIWMVNLDRRKDRWDQWASLYPELAKHTQRFNAIDGKQLVLTESLAKLFAKNDFKWKKSVAGCALSHIILWLQLVSESSDVNSYLVFEDDMRFKDEKGWKSSLNNALNMLPPDTEVAYLGGILPGNKPGYPNVLQKVNDTWSVILPNTMFTRIPAPVFHFCTYSYYITKAGAEKLLRNFIAGGAGCFTSIDHYMGNPVHGLIRYVMTDVAVTCFQEDDPVYVKSDFDNYNRIDSFDSDIWNNKDMFTLYEINKYNLSDLHKSMYIVACDVLRICESNPKTRTLLAPREYFKRIASMGKNEEIEEILKYLHKITTYNSVESQNITMPSFSERSLDLGVIYKDGTGISQDDNLEEILKLRNESKLPVYNRDLDEIKKYKFLYVSKDIDLFYNILAGGAIPIYVRSDGEKDTAFWSKVKENFSMIECKNAAVASQFIDLLIKNPEKAETYRSGLMSEYIAFNLKGN